MHKSPQSVKKSERAMTPDGRAIPRKGKKKINDNKNKVKAVNNTFQQKKIVKRISHNNNNANHNDNSVVHSPNESKNNESYENLEVCRYNTNIKTC